jgi:hypothetical protein
MLAAFLYGLQVLLPNATAAFHREVMLGEPVLFYSFLGATDVETIRLFSTPKPIAVKTQSLDRFLNLAGELQQVWILCDSTPRGNGVLDLPAVRSTDTVVAMAKVNNKLIGGNGELALAAHDHFVLGELKE